MDPTPDAADFEYLLSGVTAPASVPLPAAAPVPPPPPAAPAPAASASTSSAGEANPKKRPLEDKKARERKRVLRNRELARVSNERRKGRIKAMENELTETRQTVTTLEESIRCLEAENKELRNLLQGKPAADPQSQPPGAAAAAAAAAAVAAAAAPPTAPAPATAAESVAGSVVPSSGAGQQ